jgi:peroxiredoxin
MLKLASVFLVVLSFLTVSVKKDNDTKVQNFTLEDYNGVKHSLSDYKDSKAIVLMFISTQCPVSNSYNGRMNDLCKNYHEKQITFIGINSNKAETIEDIKHHAEEKGFKFPILKDWKNIIANRLGATVTPEIYVLNPDFEILYHGRIDNSSRIEKVSSRDLRNALEEILASKPVTVSSTKAFGCTIKKVD